MRTKDPIKEQMDNEICIATFLMITFLIVYAYCLVHKDEILALLGI